MDAHSLRDAVAAISPAEWVAVALALAYLVLAVRQHIACWIFAATSSAVFLWLFARAGLVMQAALQVFYIAMAAYGWYSWRGGVSAAQASRPVMSWAPVRHLAAIATIVLVSAVNGALSSSDSPAVVRYLDALTAWGSVFATWLVARKVLENWLYWLIVDGASVYLYFASALPATAILFTIYLGIVIAGYFSWRRALYGVSA